MKPASKWHLKTMRTRLISGDGGGGVAAVGVCSSFVGSNGDALATHAVLPVARRASRNFRLRIYLEADYYCSCEWSFDYVNRVKPGFHEFRPVGDRLIRRAKAPGVAAFCVEMQFGGDFGVFQREEINGGVFNVDRIVFGLNDEGWRSFFVGMDFGVGRHVLFGDGEVTGVNDDGEIGAAALRLSAASTVG